MDITCVMSVYDEPVWMIKRAIESIENQTYKVKTFIIVVDKTDNYSAIEYLTQHAANASDMYRVVINDRNRGLAYSLNRGFELAETEYVCRMDADDEALPTRLEESVKFMQMNDLDLCATAVKVVDENGNTATKQRILPCSQKAIKHISRYAACLIHPTWLMKKKLWTDNGRYREGMVVAQDYDFVMRALKLNAKIASVNTTQLLYTERSQSASGKRVALQLFLTLYAQANIYRGRAFDSEIAKKAMEGLVPEYNRFKKYIEAFLAAPDLKKKCFIAALGMLASEEFRRYVTNTVMQKMLRRYYLKIDGMG